MLTLFMISPPGADQLQQNSEQTFSQSKSQSPSHSFTNVPCSFTYCRCCALRRATIQHAKKTGGTPSSLLPGKDDPQPVPALLAPMASQHMMAEGLHWDGLSPGEPS